MLNIRNYLEDMRHVIHYNSPAHLKMFAFRYMAEDPNLQIILSLDRVSLKLYLYYLKTEVLPLIDKHLENMADEPVN